MNNFRGGRIYVRLWLEGTIYNSRKSWKVWEATGQVILAERDDAFNH